MKWCRASILVGALLGAGCGGSASTVQAPTLAVVNASALSKMVRGVEAAQQPDGRKRAESLFTEAVKADPQLWEAQYNLGVLLAERGELESAERHLAGAVKLAPNAEDVVVALAEVRRRAGDPKGAVNALEGFG